MTRDEARILISGLIEWYTEDLGARLGMSMCKETYMDALETLWHGPEGELISRADAIEAVADRIYDDLCYMYCNNCRYDSEIGEDDPRWSCDDCYRKYNSWGISSAVAKGIAEHALSALPSADAEQVTGKLESAEAVTHGRLIDADALSEKLCETTIFIKDGEVFQRMINDAPTVSAEAVQGE